jgi:hypothetical protein
MYDNQCEQPMSMFKNKYFWLASFFGLYLLAEEDSVKTDEQIYEIKADLTSLKGEISSIKALAEQERPNSFNPKISLVGDIIGQYGINVTHHHNDDHHGHHHSKFNNGLFVRELELEFSGDIDPYANAVASFALHQNKDHVDVHVEEAFLYLTKWPALGYAPFNIKLGQFKTAFGRMNRTHLHNIPQIYYPNALTSFLGSEGYQAPGISIDRSFNPTKSASLHMFLEATFLKPLPQQDKGAEKMPNGIAHVWWHQELSSEHALDIGISGLIGGAGKKNSELFWLLGNDIHYSYIKPGYGGDPLFLAGNEFFLNKALGNFTWAQVRIFASTFLGLRYDLSPKEKHFDELEHAIGGYVSYYTSEFLRFRLGYEHAMPDIKSFSGDHRLMLSTIFVLGSHPTEPYFVNR